MTREEFYNLTDILNSEVLGNFMHGGEADELLAMFEEAVDHSNILEQEEPVSEDLEEAAKKWLNPKLDKSYANYGETKMMELTHFDGYNMLDAIEFGAEWNKKHQTWKDLELTWEDIADILDATDVIANDDSMEERLKTMSEEEYCQEVLKRFKAKKGK